MSNILTTHGGTRKGAGRKKKRQKLGLASRALISLANRTRWDLQKENINPITELAKILNGTSTFPWAKDVNAEQMVGILKDLAGYCAPKLKAIDITTENKGEKKIVLQKIEFNFSEDQQKRIMDAATRMTEKTIEMPAEVEQLEQMAEKAISEEVKLEYGDDVDE